MLTKPSLKRIATFLKQQQVLPFTYPEIGASRCAMPAGYDLDHNRAHLGTGQAVFEAACAALRRWGQFPQPWTEVHPADTPLEVGNTVVVMFRVFGVWWLSSARIVYCIDESAPIRRFGFAYGTLPGHIERGEERFSIEWLSDDSVWYDIRAFSRPRHPLVRLGYPLARRLQRRFVLNSQSAMRREVSSSATSQERPQHGDAVV